MRHPGVRFPPPVILVTGFVLGWLIDRYVSRARLVSGGSTAAIETTGIILGAAGLALVSWGMLTFRRAQTSLLPYRPASRLVLGGPYRFTRNPMYVGMTALYVALSLLANMAWPILLLPLALLVLYRLVIRREERYLEGAFGEEYAAYRRRVRRWL